jgi:putative radical SAM enzyme (TIGR03279 family)
LTYFTEIQLQKHKGGRVSLVEPDGLAHSLGILKGDELLAIDGNKLNDVIDVHYYGSEEDFELLVRRDQEYMTLRAKREYGQSLGLVFEHPTFDTDIRRCNNLCEFCFVLQMAPRFRRTLYIKDDDYRYSFLFGHFVTLTNLSEHDWWRIETMRLSPLYVSVHVTDLEMRRKFLRNDKAPDVLEQLSWLADRGIDVHTQIVVVPEFNDGEWLERSIGDLSGFWPSVRSISIVPVGLTGHHKYNMRTHTPEEARFTVDYIHRLQEEYRARLGINFVYPTDEWYLVGGMPVPPSEAYDQQTLQENGLGMVRDFFDRWTALSTEIRDQLGNDEGRIEFSRSSPYSSVALVTGTLFAPTLAEVAVEFAGITGIDVSAIPVTNTRLGETITVAGLMMAADILDQVKVASSFDLLVLPRVAFDHPQVITLDDFSPQQIANRLQVRVALAESMGDVWDVLIGNSSLLFSPADNGTSSTAGDRPSS